MLRLILDFVAYRDPRPTNNPKDATKLDVEYELNSFSELCRKSISVADSTTDQAVTLADPNSDLLIVSTDQEISVKLNGSSDSLVLKPKGSGVKTPALYLKGDVTAISVSNASGNSAQVDFISVNI